MTPKLCMKILKHVCEVRHKAFQGTEIKFRKYRVRESYYERDVLADIRGLMRAIKRPFGCELPNEYKRLHLILR